MHHTCASYHRRTLYSPISRARASTYQYNYIHMQIKQQKIRYFIFFLYIYVCMYTFVIRFWFLSVSIDTSFTVTLIRTNTSADGFQTRNDIKEPLSGIKISIHVVRYFIENIQQARHTITHTLAFNLCTYMWEKIKAPIASVSHG